MADAMRKECVEALATFLIEEGRDVKSSTGVTPTNVTHIKYECPSGVHWKNIPPHVMFERLWSFASSL